MSKLVRAFCDECGWAGKYTSEAKANYAYRQHSCKRKRRRDRAAARRRAREASVDRTPRPCTHPTADHQHGTHAAYVLDRCRCVPCTAANSAYAAQLARDNAYGRSNLIDATPAREHVRALMRAGMGLKTIVKASGVSSGAMTKLVYGVPRPDGSRRPPAARVRRDTADRVLAVSRPVLAPGAVIDSTGTRRRLQSLQALGWSVARLSSEHGIDRQRLDRALKTSTTTVSTAKAVAAMFTTIGDRSAPATTPLERASVARTLRVAHARGWQVPAAWDEDEIDQPAADPAQPPTPTEDEIDEVAIARALAGDKVKLTRAEHAEATRRTTELGLSGRRAAELLGVVPETVYRRRSRERVGA